MYRRWEGREEYDVGMYTGDQGWDSGGCVCVCVCALEWGVHGLLACHLGVSPLVPSFLATTLRALPSDETHTP